MTIPTRPVRHLRLHALSAASVFALAAGMTAGAAHAQAQPASGAPTGLGEVVVTGSRIARSGFTTPTPVTVVGSEQLERLAVTNIGDALALLPSFRNTYGPQSSNLFFNAIGARQADLRGLGNQRTLVLVDGRRFIGSTAQGSVDLNQIPTSLLSRTEVVTGGASAAYGSDAVSGVVNLILDTRLEGLKGQVQYGESAYHDSKDYQVSLAGGRKFLGGRMHVVAGGEYERNDGTGDQYTRDWGREEWNVIPNSGYVGGRSTNGLPANLTVPETHSATMSRGGVITSLGPLQDIAFNADGSQRRFNRGQFSGPIFMQNGEGNDQTPFWYGIKLVVPVERYSLFSHVDYEISDKLSVFVEASHGRVEGTNTGAQTRDFAPISPAPATRTAGGAGIIIARDNPYLAENLRAIMTAANLQAVRLGRIGQDFGNSTGESSNEVNRIVLGAKGSITESWTWDAYYQYGRNDYSLVVHNNRNTANFNRAVDAVRAPDGQIVCRSTIDPSAAVRAAAAGCQPLNPFGEFQWTPQAKAYAFGTSTQDTRYTQQVAAVNLTGDLFTLPAGALSVAVGLEHRTDEAEGSSDPVSAMQGWYIGNGSPTNGKIEVSEGYAEAVVPILKDMALAKSLEFNGAVRRTHYNLAGDVTTWKVGGTWDPTDFLRLRVSRSRDIRAPNIEELFVTSAGFLTVRDPFNNNAQGLIFTRQTANQDLQPEKADTTTVGVVFTPHWGWSQGIRVSLDYYKIDIQDAISRPSGQIALDRCFAGAAQFCSLITRATPGNQNSALLELATPNLNIAGFKTTGLDIEVAYQVPMFGGSFNVRALASYVGELSTTDTAGKVDRAGQNGFPIALSADRNRIPTAPDWTGDLTGTWTGDRLSLTAQVRFIHGGTYDVTMIGPQDPGYDINLVNSIDDNEVEDVTYFNLSGSYDLITRDSRRVQVFGAINNLFNKDPPVAPGNGVTNLFLYDTVGRYFKAGVRFNY